MHAASGQVGDERVPEGMEIDDSRGCAVTQVVRFLSPLALFRAVRLVKPTPASCFQVLTNHLGRFVRNTEDRLAAWDFRDMCRKQVGQFRQ